MTQRTIEIQLSEPLLQFGFDEEEIQRRVVEWLVISLFTEERISSGKAAQLLGVSRLTFLALLRDHGVAYIDYTEGELQAELSAAESIEPYETSEL